jgi:hypothetical protein
MEERVGPSLKRGPVLFDGHWAMHPDSRSAESAIVTIDLMRISRDLNRTQL